MCRSIKIRRPYLPGAHPRSQASVRISDVVLAVLLVALLGAFCLTMAAALDGAVEEVAAFPVSAHSS